MVAVPGEIADPSVADRVIGKAVAKFGRDADRVAWATRTKWERG
jgi:hypothetical protein